MQHSRYKGMEQQRSMVPCGTCPSLPSHNAGSATSNYLFTIWFTASELEAERGRRKMSSRGRDRMKIRRMGEEAVRK